MNLEAPHFKRISAILLISLGVLGVFLRFYKITQNQFIYYDEGLYFDLNRKLLNLIQNNFPKNLSDFLHTLQILFFLSLGTGKALWIFLSDLRVYFLGTEAWYFPRLLSAVFGSLTLIMSYLFARKYFQSRWAGLLTLAFLALLPSHIYYSRLALQESCSTFFFISGMYLYLFPRSFGWRTFLSGVLFGCVYFTNYRMIIVPLLLAGTEFFISFADGQKPNFRKYLWSTVVFLAMVILVGNLYQARNFMITFPWMFHQSQLAEGRADLFSFLSYPFYIFYLESIGFGILFFGSIYFLIKRRWKIFFPFLLACLQMAIFSFAQEKAVRYICVVMPFMAMAAAALIEYLYQEKKSLLWRRGLILCVVLVLSHHFVKGMTIANFRNNYETSMKYVLNQKKPGHILSTQSYIQKLYAPRGVEVMETPHYLKSFLSLYSSGYKYLIVDPQAYVSCTQDKNRFSFKLDYYLQYILENVKPKKIFPHFDKALLSRFVLEHNENLKRSLAFLRANQDGQLGVLRVYDMDECIRFLTPHGGQQR